MLVNPSDFLGEAKRGNYAVPAPNFFDLNSARSYVKVAEKLQKPVILALAESHLGYIGLEEGALIGKFLAKKANVPVALHLDHGFTEKVIQDAVALGFTSVMIDASTDPFDRNVARTKAIVDFAAPQGVQVEAEIGHVGSGENYENLEESDSEYTTVDEAKEFVRLTGIDSLAVSIGTAHGIYKGEPHLNFDRLHELQREIAVPLVLHGSSGSGDENLHRSATEGISKINVFTDFDQIALKAVTKQPFNDYTALLTAANNAIEDMLEHYYGVFSTQ
ncbi:MAG: class II fructose-bisphosphate aldolase [Bifidobacteriaceae bacterium]|jgi:fructose-bisphosphate aldolase class II|nr:class II fructose-bisphosphate aldolase [Bifidobacteriaceae bacterium]